MRRVRTAVLISGTGSNMVKLVEAAQDPTYPADIVFVLSNRPGAPGLARAQAMGIETAVVDHKAFATRDAFDAAVHAQLAARDIELVALAGFMRVLTPYFTRQWEGRMINIHPSLLPKHRGLDTYRRALEAGDTEHGATVHWVTAELDAGETILQQSYPIPGNATVADLQALMKPVEHSLYPKALELAANCVRDIYPA